MWLAEKRRIRDRRFVQYEPKKHFVRAYAMSASIACTWDLFPPVKGFRPFNAKVKRSYNVSPKRQHSDWSKMVIQRDDRYCQNCGVETSLEAHHIWPQSWYPQLRYILKNGITLCRPCHEVAFHATEITPGQFLALTNETKEINSNIEASNFWEHYTAGLQKGRILAYQLMPPDEMLLNNDEKEHFISWAALNDFIGRTEIVAREAPIKDDLYKISSEMQFAIEAYKNTANLT